MNGQKILTGRLDVYPIFGQVSLVITVFWIVVGLICFKEVFDYYFNPSSNPTFIDLTGHESFHPYQMGSHGTGRPSQPPKVYIDFPICSMPRLLWA